MISGRGWTTVVRNICLRRVPRRPARKWGELGGAKHPLCTVLREAMDRLFMQHEAGAPYPSRPAIRPHPESSPHQSRVSTNALHYRGPRSHTFWLFVRMFLTRRVNHSKDVSPDSKISRRCAGAISTARATTGLWSASARSCTELPGRVKKTRDQRV